MIRIQIDDLTIEKHGALYATPRFRHHIHDRIALHHDVKAQHQCGPTCTKRFSDRVSAAGRRK